MSTLRENWRVFVLAILLVGSAIVLFVPGATFAATGASDGPTNLQYGIELDGGARVRAQAVGLTATDVAVQGNASALEQSLAQSLDVDPIDVRVAPSTNTVEVFGNNTTKQAFANALQQQGYEVTVDDIRRGVTSATRQDMVDVISDKLSESALSGGSVRTLTAANGEHYIVIEAPNRDVSDIRELLSSRGVVRVYAFFPRNGTYAKEQVLQQDDFASISNAQQIQGPEQGYFVRVTLTQQAAERFANEMVKYGYGDGANCNYNRQNPNASTGACLLTELDGKVVFAGGVQPDLGRSFRTGDFAKNPTFRMTTTSQQEARELELALKAGRLKAPLEFEQTSYLEPALASKFKTNSLVTGLVAVLAVSLVVYFRYGDARVAAPMVVTALSEVFLLLGFAAAVQYPLDLSVIAGFIAVIGTGVDDLIIIADEVMSEGSVDSSRIFENRFKRAFWVIGAAAATTIIAMAPLAVLSLGDLRGFAIVTILGVIIGITITRPAYGDILRTLLTKR